MTREPRLIVVCGRKGVGKSYTTIDYIREYAKGDPTNGIPGRKVLIFDVNNEYGDRSKFPDIRTIPLAYVPVYSKKPVAEIRRVTPFFDNGMKMTLRDMSEVLQWILRNYYNGLLLIEDVNKYVSDNMPSDIIGAICTNRHSGVDIIIQYQSIGRVSPKVWQNLNVIRMHKNTDSVDRHENKFEDKYECLKIAEKIITKRVRNGDMRFFLFVDFDEEKIRFDETRIKEPVQEEEIEDSIREFVSENHGRLNINAKLLQTKKGGGKVFKDRNEAIEAEISRIYDQYFS